jgi:TetR/AcrR family transcriptional regulator, tetracycline repressor protein
MEQSSSSQLPRFPDGSEGGGGRQPLTRSQVVKAALDLMDETGLDGLTMRRLGERLGVKSASLYWHVRNKDELLNLVADAVCSEVQTPPPTAGWREYAKAIAWEYRRVLHAHTDAAELLATTLPIGPHRLRLAEMGLATLLEAGFDPVATAMAGLLFTDYVTNFVLEETRAEAIAAAFQTDADPNGGNAIREWFSALPTDLYPSLVALAPHLSDLNPDTRFEFGLHTILAGLPPSTP